MNENGLPARYTMWLSRVDAQVQLFWGRDFRKLDIPWGDYFEAGLSPAQACTQAVADGHYKGSVGSK